MASIAAAAFLIAVKEALFDPGLVENAGGVSGNLFHMRIVAEVAAGKIE